MRLAWAAGLLLAIGGGAGAFYWLGGSRDDVPQIADGGVKPREKEQPKEEPPKEPVPEQPKPFDVKFAELKEKPQQERLVKELAKLPAGRLDVYVGNGSLAVERILRQFQLPPLKKSKQKEDQFIFVENFRPAELVSFLVKLANDDRKTNFVNMQLQPMQAGDTQLLCGLLKIEPDELRKPPERTTLPNIIEAPKDKDPIVKVQPKTPPSEGRGLILAAGQDEIRNFVDRRRQLTPGTVQLLLVVHTI